MKNRNFFIALTACLCCIFTINNAHAQKPRIAIVPLADSTLVCLERKTFDNFIHPVDADIPIVQYIVESIAQQTNLDYEASICMPPETICSAIQNSQRKTIGRDLLKWAKEQREYDYFIFLKNNTVCTQVGEHVRISVPENSSGIVKEDNGNSLFTTIGIHVYEPSRSNFLHCFDYFDKYFYDLHKVKLPENDYSFSGEVTEKLRANFRAFMAQRVKHVLANTIYMVEDEEEDYNDAPRLVYSAY